MKILMALTSHDRLGATGEKTGFWLEEFGAPYYVFNDAGAEITLASPKGGQPPPIPEANPLTRRLKPRAASTLTARLRSSWLTP